MSIPISRILLSLDDILDTRLGTIDKINPLVSFDILIDGDYYSREKDDWTELTKGKITTEQFNEAYKKRDINTLKHSRLSNIAVWIRDFTHEAVREWQNDPVLGLPKLHVNHWPYQLTEQQKSYFLDSISAQCVDPMTEVEMVYYSPEKITPQLLFDNYNYYFNYDWNTWKDLHVEAFQIRKTPNVVVHAPKLYTAEQLTAEELKIDGEKPIDPWRATEFYFFEYMHLSMFEAFFWNTVIPDKPNK